MSITSIPHFITRSLRLSPRFTDPIKVAMFYLRSGLGNHPGSG
jgi:hypothetical protein